MLDMYPEHNPSYGLKGVEPTIEQRLGCHKNASYAGDLGQMLRTIHGVTDTGTPAASCFNCHTTDSEGNLVLWDAVKHDQLHGINDVADVEGNFTWDQDYTVSAEEMPNAQWMGNYYDELRFNNERDGVPLDQEMFDTWEFSITGMVGEEKTWTLPELLEEAPIETAVLSTQCTINPLGGEAVAQVGVTGIPLRWFFDQVDIDLEATSFSWVGGRVPVRRKRHHARHGALAQAGEWTISVGGTVAHSFDASTEEMADEASQTIVLGCSCAGNPADGIASINAEVTGVAVTELLRHAEPVEGANTVVFTSADGYEVPASPSAGDAAEASANLPNVGVFFGGAVE